MHELDRGGDRRDLVHELGAWPRPATAAAI